MRRSSWLSRLLAMIVASVALAGCHRDSSTDPPDIRYGEDPCQLCRMIISDERFAAAVVVEAGRGTVAHAFDDIGCLLGFETEGNGEIVARYVRGFGNREWLRAEDACYVFSSRLQTPMASGTAACSSQEAARELLTRHAGESLDWRGLQDRFARGELQVLPFTPGDEIEHGIPRRASAKGSL